MRRYRNVEFWDDLLDPTHPKPAVKAIQVDADGVTLTLVRNGIYHVFVDDVRGTHAEFPEAEFAAKFQLED